MLFRHMQRAHTPQVTLLRCLRPHAFSPVLCSPPPQAQARAQAAQAAAAARAQDEAEQKARATASLDAQLHAMAAGVARTAVPQGAPPGGAMAGGAGDNTALLMTLIKAVQDLQQALEICMLRGVARLIRF